MKPFCVIGSPISHSLSPRMQGAAFKEKGVEASYEAVEVLPENLKEFMAGFADTYSGMNVTIPHKENVMRYLDEVDDRARTIGAVNTVVNEGGRLVGYNTDWIGFTEALLEGAEEKNGAFLVNKPVLVVGAGGAARAVCYALKQLGAELYITNRTLEKAEQLAGEFQGHALALTKLNKIQPLLVVNVTSLGMHPHEGESPLPQEIWQSWKHAQVQQFAFDCVYTQRTTQFLKDALIGGFKSSPHGHSLMLVTGENMLIHQGAVAFELFTGQKAPIEAMRSAIVGS